MVVPGFPKTVKSKIVCGAFAKTFANVKDVSTSNGNFVNSFNFDNGVCKIAKIPYPAIGMNPTSLYSSGWHLQQGCYVRGIE